MIFDFQIAIVSGVVLILASHLTTKIWPARLGEKFIVGVVCVFIGHTGNHITDACLTILAWSSLGAILTTIGNTMASLEDMEKSGELEQITENLNK